MSQDVELKNSRKDSDVEVSKPKSSRTLIKAVCALLFLVACIVLFAYWLATRKPDFFLIKNEVSSIDLKQLSDRFEISALDLQNQARSQEEWQAQFVEAEINAWMAGELEATFPDALPENLGIPKIQVRDDELKIGAKWNNGTIETVLNVSVDVFFSDTPGELVIQIKQAYAGRLPIPVSVFASTLSDALSKTRLPVTWTESESNPTVLVQLPREMIQLGDRSVRFEYVHLLVEKLVVVGRSPKAHGP